MYCLKQAFSDFSSVVDKDFMVSCVKQVIE